MKKSNREDNKKTDEKAAKLLYKMAEIRDKITEANRK
jgi:hypothetical protein